MCVAKCRLLFFFLPLTFNSQCLITSVNSNCSDVSLKLSDHDVCESQTIQTSYWSEVGGQLFDVIKNHLEQMETYMEYLFFLLLPSCYFSLLEFEEGEHFGRWGIYCTCIHTHHCVFCNTIFNHLVLSLRLHKFSICAVHCGMLDMAGWNFLVWNK